MTTTPVLSSKLQWKEENVCLLHWCPHCNVSHQIPIANKTGFKSATWHWDGNAETPSFSPSLAHTRVFSRNESGVGDRVTVVCHYFIRLGVIEYQKDCSTTDEGQATVVSNFAGQKIPMPDIPATAPVAS